MLQIYIAQHGQDEDSANGIVSGRRDFPLTKLGREQARELTTGIRGTRLLFDAVYSSPLRRAKETADTVCIGLDLPKPEVLEDLTERELGSRTGTAASDIDKYLNKPGAARKITYFVSPPGAEVFSLLFARTKRVVAEVRKRHKDGLVLLVTHEEVGKMLYAAYYELDWMRMLSGFEFKSSELLVLDPTSKGEEILTIPLQQRSH